MAVGRVVGWVLAVLGSVVGPDAGAATISAVSPQGEVAQVRQVVVSFSEAVVPLGDLRQPDPVTLSCTGASPTGTARWTTDRQWVFDFAEPPGPGLRCMLKPSAGWKPLNGTLTGPTEFRFSTGGPAVLQTQPHAGSPIEEEQAFILRLSGPVPEAEALARTWCEVEGLAEKLPVRALAGAEREALLKARRLDRQADRVLIVQCGRPLPPNARLRLVWGRGIPARQSPQVVTTVEQRFDYRVREAFTASFTCERENANAACLPIRPLGLRFSASVSRALAEQVRLEPAGGAAIAPSFDKDDRSQDLTQLSFNGPFAERARFTLKLPRELKDLSGRPLANAASFPLQVATGDAPPIAKFAAAPFGVIERLADATLPVTLRHVQGDLRPQAAGGQVRVKTLKTDADIIAWSRRVERHHENEMSARDAGLPASDWYQVVDETDDRGRVTHRRVMRQVHTRELSLLDREPDARRLDLPALAGGDPRPFEVVGIPLPEPGYHVVEIASQRLGRALLDRDARMYVRTGVLVTNLGVHLKLGRENAVVWVTTLDRGRPVAGAEVAISDCHGKPLWTGRTGEQGVAVVPARPPTPVGCPGDRRFFASARKADEQGLVDLAFVWDGWTRGIEGWRFNLPTSDEPAPDLRAHTVFDRTLLRAGETVSMKHFLRRETAQGLAMPDAAERPTRLKIIHEGSGDEVVQPLDWGGGRAATSRWHIPAAARLGSYRVEMDNPGVPDRRRRVWRSGDFRVEEFRVPLVDARLMPPRSTLVAPQSVLLAVQLSHLSGGGVAQAALRGTALLRPRAVAMPGYDDYGFEPPRSPDAGDEERGAGDADGRLVADRQPITTDREGAAGFEIKGLPPITRAGELVAEIAFDDPNGEVQTVGQTLPVWPSAVVPGIKAAGWASSRGRVHFTAIALDTAGKPLVGQVLEVRGRLTQQLSTRKRMVGGFYAYDHHTEVKELGRLCNGRSDDRGLLLCEAELTTAGQVELIVSARDVEGRLAEAATGVWVTRQGELWFEQDNDDRVDLLPEKKRYEPGETARLQLRMPFREASALVAVEREGVIETRVITLRGDDPSFELKIDKAWAPNVYVSVLAVRGRVHEVRWTSFFTWGWKAPLEWFRAYTGEGRDHQPPTAMVDLSRPAFKLGVAALQVGLAAHELQVSVTPDQPAYTVRGKARVRVKVSQGGQPVAGAGVAFAAVDEGLLALRENTSWQLLPGLMRPRAWGVQTATGHGEIVGRRHYGRKAVAAGGGGGRGATRELFDTLLLWLPEVALDAQGEALVEVPLNDSLSAFRLVAVADAGAQQFGTGSARIRVSQDLQVLSGLPPLVRDGDRFLAVLTLRNTTSRDMTVRATLQGSVQVAAGGGPEFTRAPLVLPPQELGVPAGGVREASWTVEVPDEAFSIVWEAAADEQGGGGAKDRLKRTQLVASAVPLRVMQATLMALDAPLSLPVAAPADALPAGPGPRRGGLVLGLQPRLSGALPGIRRYFETYPFSCLEQKTSKAVGLRDAALWAPVAGALAAYLDRDGLASYFPTSADESPRGSDRLTAYVIAATHEAGFELPPAARDRMLDGLAAFVEGRIERRFWSPRADLDVRKLAALEALSRHGRMQPRMLGSIQLLPNQWPTAALIDWLRILRRVDGIPGRARHLEEVQQILRARITYGGTTLKFSTEADDFWWWLMDSGDANAARLILAVLDDPAWKDELPRLVVGALGRQNHGAWLTTTANLWGSLALDKFSARFESVRVAGRSLAAAGGASQALDWSARPDGGPLALPWPAAPGNLVVSHQGSGRPWLTVQALAAVPLGAPVQAGYAVTRSVSAVEQKVAGRWSRGDVMRVRLEIEARSDMTWVVVSDPVPGGATVLGSGLGRDSQIATRGERREGRSWPAYEERGFEAFRSYYAMLPRGRHVVEYSLRLNNPGRFGLPPTRMEAMYAPESFGEQPNAPLEVAP